MSKKEKKPLSDSERDWYRYRAYSLTSFENATEIYRIEDRVIKKIILNFETVDISENEKVGFLTINIYLKRNHKKKMNDDEMSIHLLEVIEALCYSISFEKGVSFYKKKRIGRSGFVTISVNDFFFEEEKVPYAFNECDLKNYENFKVLSIAQKAYLKEYEDCLNSKDIPSKFLSLYKLLLSLTQTNGVDKQSLLDDYVRKNQYKVIRKKVEERETRNPKAKKKYDETIYSFLRNAFNHSSNEEPIKLSDLIKEMKKFVEELDKFVKYRLKEKLEYE